MFEIKFEGKPDSKWLEVKKIFRPRRKKFFYLFALMTISIIAVFGFQRASMAESFRDENYSAFEALRDVGAFILSPDRELQAEARGKINILLLGVGGNGYYGNFVTDTIMLASLKFASNIAEAPNLTLLSLPRDLAVTIPGQEGQRKINEVYKFGELSQSGSGIEKVRETVKEWTGEEADYYALVDLEGFVNAINAVGGVDLEIDRSFTDRSYPDYDLGFEPEVKFDAGPQHLDGERALQYARSRHGNNGEGSDFSRIKRQQKILIALRAKVQNADWVDEVGMLWQLVQTAGEYIKTDAEVWELKRLYFLLRNSEKLEIKLVSLDPKTGLVCSEIDEGSGLYMLKFCPGINFDQLRDFASKSLN